MKTLKYGAFALIGLVLLGIAAFAFLGMQSRGGAALGLENGQLAACPSSPNCVSSEAGTEEDKSVAPLSLASWEALPSTLAAMGGTVTVQEDAYLAAEFSSSLFGFVDDIEFRRTDAEVHVRSASRVGHSDAGVNLARVDALRAELAAE